jgi:hypothetical protein
VENVGSVSIMGGIPTGVFCQDIKFRDVNGYVANLGQNAFDLGE